MSSYFRGTEHFVTMENDMMNASLLIADNCQMAYDAVSPHMFSGIFCHSGTPDNGNCRQMMLNENLFSPLQEEGLNNMHLTNDVDIVHCDIPVSRDMSHAGDTSFSGSIGYTTPRSHLVGTSLSAVTLANILSTPTGLQDNADPPSISSCSSLISEQMKGPMSNDNYSTLSSSLTASINCKFWQQDNEGLLTSKDGNIFNSELTYKGDYDEILGYQMPSARTVSTVRPSYHVIGSSEPGWCSNKSGLNFGHPYKFNSASNELSLSLGSCQPSMVNMPSVPDQCSEVSCSGLTKFTSKDNIYPGASELQNFTRSVQYSLHGTIPWKEMGMGQSISNNEELYIYHGSSSPIHFSHVLLGSRYLHAAQRIFSEIASYALADVGGMDDQVGGSDMTSFSSSCSSEGGLSLTGFGDFHHLGKIKFDSSMDSLLRDQESAKKVNLLSMLQMVEQRYNQCLDRIHNVTSAFQSATASGTPQFHARFILHTVSFIYKNLRDRITNQIILISQQPNVEHIKQSERTFESSFIRRQWALQQLKRNDQQSWRPQRGLPENSVSVLRAWMFQNFLHPYPKDNEKHMLAIQSGLTRSQVSNWFINARVRLWKPLIEEMYSDLNKRNRTEEGSGGDSRSHTNIVHQRIQMD